MAVITPEIKEFIKNNLGWITTVSKDGELGLGPKMSLFVLDDTHIAYHERRHNDFRRQIRHDVLMEQGQHAQAGADHAQTHQPLGRNRLHGEFGEQIAATP